MPYGQVHFASLQSHRGLFPRTAVGPQGRCITNQRQVLVSQPETAKVGRLPRDRAQGEGRTESRQLGRAYFNSAMWQDSTARAKQVPQRTAIKLRFIVRDPKEPSSSPKRLSNERWRRAVWRGWGAEEVCSEELLPLTCPGKRNRRWTPLRHRPWGPD